MMLEQTEGNGTEFEMVVGRVLATTVQGLVDEL